MQQSSTAKSLHGHEQQIRATVRSLRRAIKATGTASPQHILLTGPDDEVNAAILHEARRQVVQETPTLPIAFVEVPKPDPHFAVPHHLLGEVVQQLREAGCDRLEIPSGQDITDWDALKQQLDEALDHRFGAGKGLVIVLIKRIDEYISCICLTDFHQSQLRELLQFHPRFMLAGTAPDLSLQADYERPIFQLFRHIPVSLRNDERAHSSALGQASEEGRSRR